MKTKQIHEFVSSIVESLSKKCDSERKNNLPDEIKEYTKGQLYEACYILEGIEKIIYSD